MTSTPLSTLRTVALDQEYDPPLRGLYVAVSGDVSVVDMSGNTTVIASLSAGAFHPLIVKRVNATGTTATGLIGGI